MSAFGKSLTPSRADVSGRYGVKSCPMDYAVKSMLFLALAVLTLQ